MRTVAHERLDFLRRRWQADEIEAHPAKEGPAIRFLRGFQASAVEAGEDEAVDVVPRPGRVLHRFRAGFAKGWKAQCVFAASINCAMRVGCWESSRGSGAPIFKNAGALAQYRVDQLDDVISTTTSVFLGVTLGCARCHDHKTDPFTARDYYSLLANFNGTEKLGLANGAKDQDEKDIKDTAHVYGLVETSVRVPPTHVLLRGLAQSKDAEVPPAAPAVLAAAPLRFPKPAADAKSSGRRRTLAEWIAAPDNSLTWRVLANRLGSIISGRASSPRRATSALAARARRIPNCSTTLPGGSSPAVAAQAIAQRDPDVVHLSPVLAAPRRRPAARSAKHAALADE